MGTRTTAWVCGGDGACRSCTLLPSTKEITKIKSDRALRPRLMLVNGQPTHSRPNCEWAGRAVAKPTSAGIEAVDTVF